MWTSTSRTQTVTRRMKSGSLVSSARAASGRWLASRERVSTVSPANSSRPEMRVPTGTGSGAGRGAGVRGGGQPRPAGDRIAAGKARARGDRLGRGSGLRKEPRARERQRAASIVGDRDTHIGRRAAADGQLEPLRPPLAEYRDSLV